jgi:hypothetical protein
LIANSTASVGNIQTYQITSGTGAPNPTLNTVISGSNVLLRVTDTGTFSYKGYAQLF